jgi:hypothetical protein
MINLIYIRLIYFYIDLFLKLNKIILNLKKGQQHKTSELYTCVSDVSSCYDAF